MLIVFRGIPDFLGVEDLVLLRLLPTPGHQVPEGQSPPFWGAAEGGDFFTAGGWFLEGLVGLVETSEKREDYHVEEHEDCEQGELLSLNKTKRKIKQKMKNETENEK